MDGEGGAFDQPAQAGVGCRIERRRQKVRELACRRVGQAMKAAFPARQGRRGDAEQLGRMALLDAAQAAPPSRAPAVLVHDRGAWPWRERSSALARRHCHQATPQFAKANNAMIQPTSKPRGVIQTTTLPVIMAIGRPMPKSRPPSANCATLSFICLSRATGSACGTAMVRQGSCMKAATRSAIMMVGALVLPPTSVGITEASTTRSPCRPWTRQRWSTTAIGSLTGPILQVPTGWYSVSHLALLDCSLSGWVFTAAPGWHSSAR